jgi:hypothetical protein
VSHRRHLTIYIRHRPGTYGRLEHRKQHEDGKIIEFVQDRLRHLLEFGRAPVPEIVIAAQDIRQRRVLPTLASLFISKASALTAMYHFQASSSATGS